MRRSVRCPTLLIACLFAVPLRPGARGTLKAIKDAGDEHGYLKDGNRSFEGRTARRYRRALRRVATRRARPRDRKLELRTCP